MEEEAAMTAHDMSDKPTEFWKIWKRTAKVMRLQVPRAPSSPPEENKVTKIAMFKNSKIFYSIKKIFL